MSISGIQYILDSDINEKQNLKQGHQFEKRHLEEFFLLKADAGLLQPAYTYVRTQERLIKFNLISFLKNIISYWHLVKVKNHVSKFSHRKYFLNDKEDDSGLFLFFPSSFLFRYKTFMKRLSSLNRYCSVFPPSSFTLFPIFSRVI